MGGAISYAIRHLRNKHNIDVRADEMAIPLQPPSLFSSVATAATALVTSGVAQQYGVIIGQFAATPRSAGLLPNREIYPAS